jgi:hypothetical protein
MRRPGGTRLCAAREARETDGLPTRRLIALSTAYAEQIAAGSEYLPVPALAAREPGAIEIFQHLDRQVAAYAGFLAE